MILVPRRAIHPNPVSTDTFDLGQARNRLHVARSRANINGIGGSEPANWAEHFAKHEAVPQMINRAKNALKVNTFFMNVYFKLHSGKRCSCWGKGETPDGYCVSCFPPGTLVRSESGYVPIETIEIGDKVLSSDGRFHRVTEVMSREYKGDLVSVTPTVSTSQILSTPEHPFKSMVGTHSITLKKGCGPKCDVSLSHGHRIGSIRKLPSGRWHVRIQISGSRIIVGTFNTKKQARKALDFYKKEYALPKHSLGWQNAEALSEKSWLVAKFPTEINDLDTIGIPDQFLKNTELGPERNGQEYFVVDEDFLWIVGIYIAEGSTSSRRLTFSLHKNEIEYQNRIVNYFEHLGYTTKVSPKKDSNGTDVFVYSTTLAQWFPKLFGNKAWKKRIPERLMRLPINKARSLLNGIFDGDGSKTESDPRIIQTSEILTLQLSEILHRIGEQPLVLAEPYRHSGFPNGKLAYGISWKYQNSSRKHWNRTGRWWYGSEILTKVRRVGDVHYHGKVYNLEVEDTHDYVVNGVVVHNCFKSGYVGGYDKYRCQTDLIDSTHSDLSLVNVQPDYKSGRVPIPLTLISKATAGVIEVAVKLQPNAGILDLWKVYASDTTGSSVTVFVKSPTERSWTKATEESVQARLQSGILLIRVEMKRDTTETAPPFLKAIRLRYQLQPGDIRVKMNIPLGDDSFQLQDLGIFETFQTLTFFTDNTLSVVRNEDVIVNPRDGRRFMITNVRLFNPSNTIVSWLLTGRFVNSENDSFNEYPL